MENKKGEDFSPTFLRHYSFAIHQCQLLIYWNLCKILNQPDAVLLADKLRIPYDVIRCGIVPLHQLGHGVD